MPGAHRSTASRTRALSPAAVLPPVLRGGRGRRRVANTAAIVLAATLAATGVGFAASSAFLGGSSDKCADGTPRTSLALTAAPTLSAPISRLAASFQQAHLDSHGKPCTAITVTSLASDRALDALARQPQSAPDVWIPESADWLGLGQESNTVRRQLPTRVMSIGGSPVVIAMPRPMATALGWPEKQMTWADLASAATTPGFWAAHGAPAWGEFRLAMANPENSAASLRAVIGTVSSLHNIAPSDITSSTFDQDRVVQGTVLNLDRSVTWLPPSDKDLLDAVRNDGADNTLSGLTARDAAVVGEAPDTMPSAFPALESDVIAYNRAAASAHSGGPITPLVASYPADGSFTATVPFIITNRASDDRRKRIAAELFQSYVLSDIGRQALVDAGLRSPAELTGRDDPRGLAPTLSISDGTRTTPPRLSLTDASDSALGTARRFFRHARERVALLVLVDTSASMDQARSDRPSVTRRAATIEFGAGALTMYPKDSRFEMWQFSSALQGGHRQLVGMKTLDAPGRTGRTHGDDLLAAASLPAVGGSTLYSTAVAAIRDRHEHHIDGMINGVIILTDGILDGRDGTAPGEPTLDQAIQQVNALNDPDHFVSMNIIALDPAADMDSLGRLARATGGNAFLNPSASDLFNIFADVQTHAANSERRG